MAEGVGFEPTNGLPHCRFSRLDPLLRAFYKLQETQDIIPALNRDFHRKFPSFRGQCHWECH